MPWGTIAMLRQPSVLDSLPDMAAVPQRVLNWLYSVLTSEYQDITRTYSDVDQTLSQYSSLTPRTEVFTYEHGASALLLNLSGTLPVNFRGTTYRFPISLWIPHAYPREPPLVYVTAKEGMAIRAGQHVDPQGKVYHPYLVGWGEFWDKSNILDFLAILRVVFAREPPVVSRQPRNVSTVSQQPISAPPPVPPPPPDIGVSSSRTSISTEGPPRPPLPPPKPYDSAGSARSQSFGITSQRETGPPLPPHPPVGARPVTTIQSPIPPYPNSHQPLRQSSLRYETAPPLPPQPGSPQASRDSSYSPPTIGPTPGSYGPQLYTQPQPGRYVVSPAQNSGPIPTYPAQPQGHQGHSVQWQPSIQHPPVQSKAKPPPPPDLIDEPLTFPAPSSAPLVAPPIPPNPEKDMLLRSLAQALHSQRQHSLSQTSSSLPGLRAQKSSMLSSLAAMTAEMHALENLSALLTSNTTILHTSLHDADVVIKSSQGRAPPGVDEMLVAPTIVGNQLYELVSEERSLGDALFVLSRAVEKGRVSASVFAKTTRTIAREWYLKKALVKKIGKGMGLVTTPASYGR